LCSWARHFTLTVPLSVQLYIKWALVMTLPFDAGDNPAKD